MNLTGAIVLYAVLWFLTLFLLLPIGLVSQEEAGEVVPGTHAGAPARSGLKKKALWATVVSAVLWAGCAYVILGGLVTREDVMGWDQFLR
ncbi:Predicted secreted protein [Paracoccus isoporae]|uniref:Predicted secreted protein n=1 Tax=Paracoccus isoporae TaxID=591205 RepID=A0A1G6STA7_9RHOB|nr:DUF1467 family protein [Paracoccus isoporae]SDD20092.1 Predicted secreted protein [Paracoccus isoporae]